MVTMSFRIRKQMFIGLFCAMIAIVAVVFWMMSGHREKKETNSITDVSGTQLAKLEKLSDNNARIAFIRSLGWEVNTEPISVEEVIIPQEFDDVYRNYNTIQKKQGLDLEKYKGKRMKRYTYEVTNYPGQSQNVYANLLLLDGKLVGGDISSTNLDGFMHGLFMPQ